MIVVYLDECNTWIKSLSCLQNGLPKSQSGEKYYTVQSIVTEKRVHDIAMNTSQLIMHTDTILFLAGM